MSALRDPPSLVPYKSGGKPFSQKEITDRCNQRNIDAGMRRWNFPYAQMGADIATYHPHLIDPNSSLYCGNNAVQAIEQMFRKPKGMDKIEFHDRALKDLTATNVASKAKNVKQVVKLFNYLATRPAAEIEKDNKKKEEAEKRAILEAKKAELEAAQNELQQQIYELETN